MKFNAFYNNEFSLYSDLKIPLSDRSIYFGDGIYDAFIGRNKKIYLKERHLERFFTNAKKMDLKTNVTVEMLNGIFDELIKNYEGEEFFLYLQLSRNSELRSHSYADDAKSNLLVTLTPAETKRYDTVLNLVTYEDTRHELCNVKTLNLISSVLASKYASINGCDEAILHRGNVITECAHSNIFIFSSGVLITHPLNNHILPGITRQRFIEISKANGVNTVEAKFSIKDLINADGIIVTSTTKLAKVGILKNLPAFTNPSNDVLFKLCQALEEDYLNSTSF